MFIVLHGHQTNTCRELRRCGFHDSGLSTFRNDNLLFSFGPYFQATHVLFVERKKRCYYRCLTSCGTLDTSSGLIACNACWHLEIWWFRHCFLLRGSQLDAQVEGKKTPHKSPGGGWWKEKFANCKWEILTVGFQRLILNNQLSL